VRSTVPHALHGRCRRSIRGADIGHRSGSRSGRPAWYDGLWDHLTTHGGVRDLAFIEALADQYAPRRTASRSEYEEFGAPLPANDTASKNGEAQSLGRNAWCVLGKRDEGRYEGTELLGDVYAQYRGAWGFNADLAPALPDTA
jgi:hypothetical protein